MNPRNLLCRVVTAAVLASALGHASVRGQAPDRISYRVSIPVPATHLVEVRVDVTTDGAALDFQMPAWSPGRYIIYDFARSVQDVAATQDGRTLAVTKLDKLTWRVIPSGPGTVAFAYRIFADNLSGTFSQVNSAHANLNGPSIFMYAVGRKQTPVKLTIDPPRGWRVVNGASRTVGQTAFEFASYDLLIDTPTEIAPELDVEEFVVAGRPYRVVVHQTSGHRQIRRFVDGIRRVVEAQHAMLGPPSDLERYTFIVHFAPDAEAPDGMEHLSSAQIVEPGVLRDDDGDDSRRLLAVISHEHFHLWNAKRLRPVELGPFDYTRENYSTSFWIVEGVTSYYGDLALARAGVISEEQLYDRLAAEITMFENRPGRTVMSLERASFDTWLFLGVSSRQASNTAQTTIDYYNKGEVVAMLLDLEIRRRTNGIRSLDDVIRFMLDKYFYAPAPPGSYYLGRGYTGADFLAAVNEVAGSDFGDWFARYVAGTADLDYDSCLAPFGLRLEKERRVSAFEYGVRLAQTDERLLVTDIDADGLAARGGLRKGDAILRINGRVATAATVRELFAKGSVEPVLVRVMREGEQTELILPEVQSRVVCKIEPREGKEATPNALRLEWLGARRR